MKINLRKIFIISILAICIISINLAVFFHITQKAPKNEEIENNVIDTAALTENFNNIFDNQINYQNNHINIQKIDSTKGLVYTNYINQDKKENLYDVNVNIPKININNEEANRINTEINNLFYNKVNAVLTGTNAYTIYGVKYKAYVNDNILSLVISATLKEGDNAQREIIKTYNYNLSSNEELGINKILEYRNLLKEEVQKEILNTIKTASENAKIYSDLGYNKYVRNPKDDMYKIENTNVFFIGENKAVYIIYPYGNLNYTSEIDLLVI